MLVLISSQPSLMVWKKKRGRNLTFIRDEVPLSLPYMNGNRGTEQLPNLPCSPAGKALLPFLFCFFWKLSSFICLLNQLYQGTIYTHGEIHQPAVCNLTNANKWLSLCRRHQNHDRELLHHSKKSPYAPLQSIPFFYSALVAAVLLSFSLILFLKYIYILNGIIQ